MFPRHSSFCRQLAGIAVFIALLLASARAQVVVTSYVETGNLPRNDDRYSAAVDLGFSINFGGTTYTQTFVSNNGYLTFGAGSGDYYPSPLNASYSGLPIIAAFFSDVDTQNPATGIVSWGTGTVNGRNAFEAKWTAVGEYYYGSSPNTFDIILVDRSDVAAGNFDLHLDYTQLTWDHGAAVAGYSNGSTTSPLFYQLPGSMTSGGFLTGGSNPLTSLTNDAVAGGFLLQARGGSFLSVAPIVSIPEPSTYALLALGVTLLGFGYRRRRA